MKRVCINPGHGGSQPGAVYGNLLEKDVNLKVAQYVVEGLNAVDPEIWVGMTRTYDRTMTLQEVCDFSNNMNVDCFVSIHCFPDNTEITMADGRIKAIKDICAGEYVMNSVGMPTRVKRTFCRSYSGPLIKIRPYKSNLDLLPTPEHPIASDYGSSPKQWGYIAAGKLRKTQRVIMPILSFIVPNIEIDLAQVLTPIYHFDVEDCQIRIKRSLFSRRSAGKSIPRRIAIDDDLLWLLGLYSADGSNQVEYYNRLGFGFNREKDRPNALRCQRIFKEKFNVNLKLSDRKTAKIIDGYALSGVVSQLFGYLVPGKSDSRHLCPLLMFLPKEKQRTLFDGWLAGDGTIYPDRFKGDSISRDLLNQYYQIALRCGSHPSYQILKGQSGYGSEKPNHRLSCSANDLARKKPKANVFFKEYPKGLALELKTLGQIEYEGDVYNLETDTGSYVANKIAVHNCNADPDEDAPGMPEAKGEEIWFFKGSRSGKKLAQCLADEVDQIFPDEPFRGLKETEDLYVLKHTNAPACLIEIGFIDNSKTNESFQDELTLRKAGSLIARGICEYLGIKV